MLELMALFPILHDCDFVGKLTAEQKAQLGRKIFHMCLAKVLQPLKDLSHSGVDLVDPDGNMGMVFPELLVYVGDMPECKLVAGCYDHARSEYPCEQCWCPRADLGNVGKSHSLRNEFRQKKNYKRMRRAANDSQLKKLCKQLSQHYVECGWWDFAGGATINCAFTGNDSLHNEVCSVSAWNGAKAIRFL